MRRSNLLLWMLVIVFVGVLTWLATTGRLQAIAGQLVDGFLGFYENIVRSLRR